mgnify:CR=1 FL=1
MRTIHTGRGSANSYVILDNNVQNSEAQALDDAAQRLATIRANIPRLAEYSKDLGSRYVVVNVPAQQIETVSGGKVYSLHNAIVGRPSRPTPVVMMASPLDSSCRTCTASWARR